MKQTDANRLAGEKFEKMFMHRAGVSGYLAIRQHLTFRYLKGGRAQPMRAELDYSLISRAGQVAYLDCKSFDTERICKSQLDRFQIERARRYCLHNVPSGFVVELRPLNLVVFFSGLTVWRLPKGQSLSPADGTELGTSAFFFFDPIFGATQRRQLTDEASQNVMASKG